jgi:hypothetical protein
MNIILQIYLEHKDDVIRNIEIDSEKSLEELHYEIIKSLNLNKQEMASFYIIDEEFNLLKEIPLFKIDEKEFEFCEMKEISIASMFPTVNSQLIYVYDFMKMWRFLVTYITKSENNKDQLNVIHQVGKMPVNETEISFKSNNDINKNRDELEDEYY